MFITNIHRGDESYCHIKGRLLYAEVKDNKDELVCMATLEFILRTFFDRQSEICNYKESFIKYLDFNNELIKHVR